MFAGEIQNCPIWRFPKIWLPPNYHQCHFRNVPFVTIHFGYPHLRKPPYDRSILSTQIGYGSFRFVSPNDEVMVTLVVVVGMGTPKRKTMRSEPESSAPMEDADDCGWIMSTTVVTD